MAREAGAPARSQSSLVQWLSIVAAIAFVAWVLSSRWEELSQAFSLTPLLFTLISVSSLATIAINGAELQVLANAFGARIPFRDGVLLGLVAYTLNYLPMKTGTVLNGVFMKARYGVRFVDFAALVWGSSIVHLWTALVAAGIALALEGAPVLQWLALVAVPSAVVAGVFAWSRVRKGGRFEDHRSLIVRSLGRAVDGIGAIFGNVRLLAVDLVINIALVMLSAWRIGWSFQAFGVEISPGQALVVSSVAIFAARLSVIPGGLGFKEGGAAAGAAMVGVRGSLGMAASVVDRAVTLVWLLVLGVPATLYLAKTTGVDLRHLRELRVSLRRDGGAGS